MDILLDTQALLWALSDDRRLSNRSREAWLDPTNSLFFSMAGYWEIALKINIGKLELAPDWNRIIENEMRRNNIRFLPVCAEHCNCVATLPLHHRDPFDRMMIAQALIESMTVMSADRQFSQYEIDIIW